MKSHRRLSALSHGVLWLSFILAFPAWGTGGEPIRLAPQEIQFAADASRPGHMAVASLYGDMGQAGLYAARVLIPAGLRVLPHAHPDDRMVVVVSGTLLVGFGDRFDQVDMKAMPPGSFFTEPAGRVHFAWARDGDVVVQVSGVGPSGTVYIQPRE